MFSTIAGLATPVFVLVVLGIVCLSVWLIRALR